MARYVRLLTKFWTDEEVVQWSEDMRILYLYLFSSPHQNIIGIYVLPKLYACADLQWSAERLETSWTRLVANDKIRYDPATSVVWVVNFLKHNPIENPKQVVAAKKVVDELPRSPVVHAFKQYVERLPQPSLIPLAEHIAKRYANTVTVTSTATSTVTGTVERNYITSTPPAEPGRDQTPTPPVASAADVEAPPSKPRRRERPADPRVKPVIDHFCTRYKERLGKSYPVAGARDGEIIRRIPRDYTAEDLCALVDAFFASDDEFIWKRAGPSIPIFLSKLPALEVSLYGKQRCRNPALDDLERFVVRE